MSTKSKTRQPISVEALPSAGQYKDWQKTVSGGLANPRVSRAANPRVMRDRSANAAKHEGEHPRDYMSGRVPQSSSEWSAFGQTIHMLRERKEKRQLADYKARLAAITGSFDADVQLHDTKEQPTIASFLEQVSGPAMYHKDAPGITSELPESGYFHAASLTFASCGADHFETGGGVQSASTPSHGADHFATGGGMPARPTPSPGADHFMTGGGMPPMQVPSHGAGDFATDGKLQPSRVVLHGADHFETGGGMPARPTPSHGADRFVTGDKAPISPIFALHGADPFLTGGEALEGRAGDVWSYQELRARHQRVPASQTKASPHARISIRDHGQRFVQKQFVIRGGMGEVWRAWDTQRECWVALKQLHPDLHENANAQRRFMLEKKLLQEVDHPNIVRFLEVDPVHDFLVMEWVEGPTLRQHIESNGRLALLDAVLLSLQVGAALTEAHAKRLIHRDLKPDNIILNDPQSFGIKLLDFGIAISMDMSRVTCSRGEVIGSAYYMSPEQMDKAKEITRAADVYSCGILFHYVVTGRIPRPSTASLTELLRKQPYNGLLLPSECPDEIKTTFAAQVAAMEELYRGAIRENPNDRISLQHWLAGLRGIEKKLRFAYERAARDRHVKIARLQKEGSAKEVRECLEDAILAYPQDPSWQRQLKQWHASIHALPGQLLKSLQAGELPLDVLRERWEQHKKSHRIPQTLGARELEEELQGAERALQKLLSNVNALLLQHGPSIALRTLLRSPINAKRWDNLKALLEHCERTINQLLDQTRSRIAGGLSPARISEFWSAKLNGTNVLPEQVVHSQYMKELYELFVERQELYQATHHNLSIRSRK